MFVVRKATINDIDELVSIEAQCWMECLRSSKKELLSRVERFSEGMIMRWFHLYFFYFSLFCILIF
jgi:hypothetical protein